MTDKDPLSNIITDMAGIGKGFADISKNFQKYKQRVIIGFACFVLFLLIVIALQLYLIISLAKC